MKKFIFMLIFLLGIISCTKETKTTEELVNETDSIEVVIDDCPCDTCQCDSCFCK